MHAHTKQFLLVISYHRQACQALAIIVGVSNNFFLLVAPYCVVLSYWCLLCRFALRVLSTLARSKREAMRQRAHNCIDHKLHHALCCNVSSVMLPLTRTHGSAAIHSPPQSLLACAAILQH